MSLTIFDTDILINVGRGDAEAVKCLQNYARISTLAISVITQMELIVGCRDKKELQIIGKFLKQFQIIELNKQISEISVALLEKFRLSHGLLIADSLIAATAIETNQNFITKKSERFQIYQKFKTLTLSVNSL